MIGVFMCITVENLIVGSSGGNGIFVRIGVLM